MRPLAAVSHFNDWLADKVTTGVATMWCAYAFLALAVYGFPYNDLTPQTFAQWLSQECIQLVMLSVIMVGQVVQARHMTALRESHADLAASHAELLDAVKGGSGGE